MSTLTQPGTVLSVSLSLHPGVPKYPQPEIHIGEFGVDGDFHAGPINRHKKTDGKEPNQRQLTIVAQEALNSLNQILGTHLEAGSIGENILVDGLGDLGVLVAGDRIWIGSDVILRVTSQNKPCATLNVYHPQIIKHLIGMRGVTAVVEHGGTVKPGDSIIIDETNSPHD
ncbi:MOSC domain-containing protein [SAR202 cluster bacterium AD-802-E10_MRT_200m]|nr:MOSC domain-containing protein [SAR202 cluster bacterium AD-802-E10_MRT_200m]